MYIEPNTVIKVLRNIPWNNTYEDTVMFASQSAQLAYMNTMVKYTFQDQTYNRVNKGVSRVKMKAENLYDCNYMMFQNSNFGNKWFFAFINKVEYINNEVSEIYFEIDEVQTWLFDFEILRCMVEREHSVTDEIGENLLPEPVALGNYVMESIQNLVASTRYLTKPDTVLVYTSFDISGAPEEGQILNGVYTGVHVYSFKVINNDGTIDTGRLRDLNDFLSTLVGNNQTEGVVNMVMCNSEMWLDTENGRTMSVPIDLGTHNHVVSLNGYTPKNNKLYTYPYSFLYVTTGNGNGISYKYEHFANNFVLFDLLGATVGFNPQLALLPTSYEEGSKYDNLLIQDNFPTCAFTYDAYRAYLAQNKYKIAGEMITTGMQTASAVASGNYMGAVTGALTKATSMWTEMASAMIKPPQVKGQNPSDTLWVEHDLVDFFFYDSSVDEQHAKIIDDFFSRFGYATNALKVPNRDSRPYWNYVKTAGCIIQGTLPADSIRKLCEIHDKGITYWRSGTVVGHYELDNRPNNGGTVNE